MEVIVNVNKVIFITVEEKIPLPLSNSYTLEVVYEFDQIIMIGM